MTEEELLKQGPDSVEDLLRRARRPLSADDGVNWHGLGEGAMLNADVEFTSGRREAGLAWSHCAVSLYDALAADAEGWNTFDHSAMYGRVNAMRHSGVLEGDLVRDPAAVIDWCRAAIDCSLDDALESTARLREAIGAHAEPSIEEVRRLRRIKNRLGVLVSLAEILELSPDLEAWIAARDRLP